MNECDHTYCPLHLNGECLNGDDHCNLRFISVFRYSGGLTALAGVRSNDLLGREAAPANRQEGCSTRALGRRSRPNK